VLPALFILAHAQTKPREVVESVSGLASDVRDQRSHRLAAEPPPFPSTTHPHIDQMNFHFAQIQKIEKKEKILTCK
jgi:hypothetical protein